MIYSHELFHYKRHDLWYKLLLTVVNSIHWFNPAMYAMVSSANRDIEYCCDYQVVKDHDLKYRKNYSDLILSHVDVQHGNKSLKAAYFSDESKNIKNRFKYILEGTERKKGIITVCTILLSSIILCSFVSVESTENNNGNDNQTVSLQTLNNEKYAKPVDTNKIVVLNEGDYLIFLSYEGEPVCSVNEGIVLEAGYDFSLGNFIKIAGNDGIQILYSNLKGIMVEEGQQIDKAQAIGTIGTTGNTVFESCGMRAFKGEERINLLNQFSFMENDQIIYKDKITVEDKDILSQ